MIDPEYIFMGASRIEGVDQLWGSMGLGHSWDVIKVIGLRCLLVNLPKLSIPSTIINIFITFYFLPHFFYQRMLIL